VTDWSLFIRLPLNVTREGFAGVEAGVVAGVLALLLALLSPASSSAASLSAFYNHTNPITKEFQLSKFNFTKA
jgi:hypothetical protein